MKYIDADKLIAEIERRISIKENLTQRPEMSDMKDSLQDIISAYQSLTSFISSLQQDQPEFPTTDEEVEKFLATAPNVELPKKYENPDWLFKKQEQPEVELENYIANKLRELGADLIHHKPYSFNRGLNVGKTNAYHDILDRLNARKEE